MSTASIAVPEAFRYIFGAIATTGYRRKEAVSRILACVTGTVDQELLARNEYLATECTGPEPDLNDLVVRANIEHFDDCPATSRFTAP